MGCGNFLVQNSNEQKRIIKRKKFIERSMDIIEKEGYGKEMTNDCYFFEMHIVLLFYLSE